MTDNTIKLSPALQEMIEKTDVHICDMTVPRWMLQYMDNNEETDLEKEKEDK